MTNLIFCYFFNQIMNLLENDVWKTNNFFFISTNFMPANRIPKGSSVGAPSFGTPWIRFVAKKNHMQKRIKIYIYIYIHMYYTDGIEKKMSAEQERFNAAPSFT